MRLPEAYVKGNNVGFTRVEDGWYGFAAQGADVVTGWQIKYLRVPDEIIDVVKEQQNNQQSNFRGGRGGGNRGDHGGRGGDRGGRGRGRGGGRGRGRGA